LIVPERRMRIVPQPREQTVAVDDNNNTLPAAIAA
jgi:hypothetical protein